MRNRISRSSIILALLFYGGVLRAQTLLESGISSYNSGDYQTAISNLESYLEADSTSESAYAYLARAYMDSKQIARAQKTLELGINHISNSVQLLAMLGQIYGNQKEYIKAQRALEQCQKLHYN